MLLIREGLKVAVIAVDPSSPVTGGSILGDKTRMNDLARAEAAFIRPVPSSGHLGGASQRARELMLLCEAAGYDVVIVETVGVGQSETEVARMVDCFISLQIAGGGDDLQGIKKGLMEVADRSLSTKTMAITIPMSPLPGICTRVPCIFCDVNTTNGSHGF